MSLNKKIRDEYVFVVYEDNIRVDLKKHDGRKFKYSEIATFDKKDIEILKLAIETFAGVEND